MKLFPKRLLLLFAGIASCGIGATALTAVVQYKPWGVPDSRRQDYDTILANLDRRDVLRERYENIDRPVVSADTRSHEVGMQDPESANSYRFEIQNVGQLNLDLSVDSHPTCDVILEKVELLPGESSHLVMHWNSRAESGPFEHLVSVKTNDPLTESLEFRIHGTTKDALVVPDSVSFAPSDPAVQTECQFVIYSQRWDELTVADVSSNLEHFDWHVEPLDPADPALDGCHATSAWRIRLWTRSMEYGAFGGMANIVVQTGDGSRLEQSIALTGRVRTPIIFHSPDIHRTDGLDIGTLSSDKEHQFHLLVRVRGDIGRPIDVLGVQPPEIKATLAPQSTLGSYRLTLTIPADCPMVVFNVPEKHGYVEVGDPNDKHFKNWFPVFGAVVPHGDSR